jgi:O-antigen ligase
MLGGRRLWLPGATLFAGLVIALLGGSRATIGIFAVGVILTVTFSIRHKPTSRKYAFAGAMALLLLMAVPGMIWANSRRSEAQKQSSDTDRTTMKLAARMIMADYPFGVGPNQYVVIANVGGYSERAGVAWNEDNRRAPVHNTYYLVAAEMGLIGLVAFLAVLGSFITLAFRMLRRHLPDINGELVPGLLVTFIVAAGHIAYEYVFMEAVTHYLFAICAGMLVAIAARANAAARRTTPAIPRPAALASNANAL